MTAKELLQQTKDLQRRCDEEKSALKAQYAMEHNPVKVGDVVTDYYHTIRVERMLWYGHPVPHMVYCGTEMTKRGEPKKRQPRNPDPVYQPCIKTINGQPYQYKEEEL